MKHKVDKYRLALAFFKAPILAALITSLFLLILSTRRYWFESADYFWEVLSMFFFLFMTIGLPLSFAAMIFVGIPMTCVLEKLRLSKIVTTIIYMLSGSLAALVLGYIIDFSAFLTIGGLTAGGLTAFIMLWRRDDWDVPHTAEDALKNLSD